MPFLVLHVLMIYILLHMLLFANSQDDFTQMIYCKLKLQLGTGTLPWKNFSPVLDLPAHRHQCRAHHVHVLSEHP